MQRYFLENDSQIDGDVRIVGDDYHHIVRVMRMSTGDKLSAVFPDGKIAFCEITSIEPEFVEAKVLSWSEENRELPISVIVGSGLLKGDKFDIVVQKGTELGATAFIPFSSKRSIVKLDEKKKGKRVDRWQKIAKEAAEQSERNMIPIIHSPCQFHEIVTNSNSYTKKIVAYEEQGRNNVTRNLPQTLENLQEGDSLFVLFGPEGGFSEEEIQFLKEHDFQVCGLGPRILRAETAPLYALAAISFYFELLR